MKFGERLEMAMAAMNWGNVDLAAKSKVADSTISALIRRGSERTQYKEELVAAFPASEISHEWLRSEKGSMKPSGGPTSTAKQQEIARLTGRLPVVGTAQLGDNGHFCELEFPVGYGDGTIAWPSNDANAYCLRCKGDSMKPRIRHGEYVVVEPNHATAPGDEVLVVGRDGRVMVKMLAYIRDGMVYLDSVNESHPRVSFPVDQIEKIHYVAGIAKSALYAQE